MSRGRSNNGHGGLSQPAGSNPGEGVTIVAKGKLGNFGGKKAKPYGKKNGGKKKK